MEWVAGKDGKPGPTGKPQRPFSNADIERDENRVGSKAGSVAALATDPEGPLVSDAVRKQKPPPLPKFKEVEPRENGRVFELRLASDMRVMIADRQTGGSVCELRGGEYVLLLLLLLLPTRYYYARATTTPALLLRPRYYY